MKNKTLITILWCCFGVALLGLAFEVFAFIFFEAFKLTAFLALVIPGGIVVASILGFLIYQYKKSKKKVQPAKEEEKTYEQKLVDFYGLLGIPVQYEKDGTIKDPYKLIGIKPVYDEKGNLMPTIYERLGFLPRFDKEGREIPTVFSIKNRVRRIARADMNDRVLIRKLSEKEMEEKIIRDMLIKKLLEAEKQGDVEKQEAIKKVAETKFPAKKETTPEVSMKPIKYKLGSGGKALNGGKISAPSNDFDIVKAFSDLLKSTAKRPESTPQPKPEPKKEPKKEPKREPPVLSQKMESVGFTLNVRAEKSSQHGANVMIGDELENE